LSSSEQNIGEKVGRWVCLGGVHRKTRAKRSERSRRM